MSLQKKLVKAHVFDNVEYTNKVARRIFSLMPPYQYKSSSGEVLTLSDLWDATFVEDLVPDDKLSMQQHLEYSAALLLFRVREWLLPNTKRCTCYGCSEFAVVSARDQKYLCQTHKEHSGNTRPLTPLYEPITLWALEEDVGTSTEVLSEVEQFCDDGMVATGSTDTDWTLGGIDPLSLMEADCKNGYSSSSSDEEDDVGKPDAGNEKKEDQEPISLDRQCQLLGLINGLQSNLHPNLAKSLEQSGGVPPKFQSTLGVLLHARLFSATNACNGTSDTPPIPAVPNDIKKQSRWEDLDRMISHIGKKAVEHAVSIEFKFMQLLKHAFNQSDINPQTDGYVDIREEGKGIHRIMSRWNNCLTLTEEGLVAKAGMNYVVQNSHYDDPIPQSLHGCIRSRKRSMSDMVGVFHCAFHKGLGRVPRAIGHIEKKEFEKRRWRIKDGEIFKQRVAHAHVMVRAEVCQVCHRSQPFCERTGCTFRAQQGWRHVCRKCGISREKHNELVDDNHFFRPRTSKTGSPRLMDTYYPEMDKYSGYKKPLTVDQAVKNICEKNKELISITYGNLSNMQQIISYLKKFNPTIRLDQEKTAMGSGIFEKGDKLIEPRHYAYYCECPDDHSVVANQDNIMHSEAVYQVVFVHRPETYPSAPNSAFKLFGVCSQSKLLANDLNVYDLVLLNPTDVQQRKDIECPDWSPLRRLYGYRSKNWLRYRTVVSIPYGNNKKCQYYVALDQSQGNRELLLRIPKKRVVSWLRRMLPAGRVHLDIQKNLDHLSEMEYTLRYGKRPITELSGAPTLHEFKIQLKSHSDTYVELILPKSLLRQKKKLHQNCVMGLPNPVKPGTTLFELRPKDQIVCMDNEYNQYVFEGEQSVCLGANQQVTGRYLSDRLVRDIKKNLVPPTCKHAPFYDLDDRICCAYCTRPITPAILSGKSTLPVCPKRRFGWRCCPFQILESQVSNPRHNHCNHFLSIFSSQGYTDMGGDKDVGWLLNKHQKPKCEVFHVDAMLGRLFFPLNQHDRHQVAPVIIGLGGSGKSLVLASLKLCMGEENCYHLPSQQQYTFDPYLSVEVTRAKRGMTHMMMFTEEAGNMNVEQFKQVVTGGSISCNVKMENSLKRIKDFNNPYICTTNNVPKCWIDADKDGSNALGRRLDFIVFSKKPKNVDNMLLHKIEANIEFLLSMLTRSYYFHRKYRSKLDFWRNVVPQSVQDRGQIYTENMNQIQAFLRRNEFVKNENAYISYDHLVMMYSNWQRKENRNNDTFNDSILNLTLASINATVVNNYTCVYPPVDMSSENRVVWQEICNESGLSNQSMRKTGNINEAGHKTVCGKFITGVGLFCMFPNLINQMGDGSRVGGTQVMQKNHLPSLRPSQVQAVLNKMPNSELVDVLKPVVERPEIWSSLSLHVQQCFEGFLDAAAPGEPMPNEVFEGGRRKKIRI